MDGNRNEMDEESNFDDGPNIALPDSDPLIFPTLF